MVVSNESLLSSVVLIDGFFKNNLCHIGFVTKSMSRSLKAWQASDAQIIIPPTRDPKQNVDCALVAWKSGPPIEIVAPGDAEKPCPIEARLRRGGGLDHLCYFSDDLIADIALHKKGGAILNTTPVYGCVFDRNIAFLTHRTGLVIELMSRHACGRMPNDPLSRAKWV